MGLQQSPPAMASFSVETLRPAVPGCCGDTWSQHLVHPVPEGSPVLAEVCRCLWAQPLTSAPHSQAPQSSEGLEAKLKCSDIQGVPKKCLRNNIIKNYCCHFLLAESQDSVQPKVKISVLRTLVLLDLKCHFLLCSVNSYKALSKYAQHFLS